MYRVYRPKAKEPGFFPRLRPSPYPSRTERLVLPRPPRPNPPLPNEILELIVNELYADLLEEEGETEASEVMATLCLVAKCFLGPARAALYRRQEIGIEGAEDVTEDDEYWRYNILDFFSDAPHLMRLIRDVDIRIDSSVRDARAAHDHIFKILEVSPRIRRLRMMLEESEEEDACKTLAGLADQCPPLRSLNVYGPDVGTAAFQDDLGRLLLSQSSIRELAVSIIDRESVPITGRGAKPTFELHSLHLRLPINDLDPSLFTLVTDTSVNSLTTLHLSLSLSHSSSDTQLDFSVFKGLKSFRCSGVLCSTNLAATLETLKVPPLTTLEISRMKLEDLGAPAKPNLNLFNYLAPTLTIIHLPAVHLVDLRSFIESGTCPNLESVRGKLVEGCSHDALSELTSACSTSTRDGSYRSEMWDPEQIDRDYQRPVTPPPVVTFTAPSRRATPLVQAVLERFWKL